MNYRRELLHSVGMVVAGISGYSAYVESVKPRVRPDANFRTGTVDDQIMDELRTGDVVLFDRSWVKRHILPAAVVSMNKAIFGSTHYDHCALVVRSHLGEVFLYEMTPTGPVLRPYDARIANSRCRQIVVLPLSPPLKFDEAGIKGVFADLHDRSKSHAISSCTYYARCTMGYISAYIDRCKGEQPRVAYGNEVYDQSGSVVYSPPAAELAAAVRILARRTTSPSSPSNTADDNRDYTSSGDEVGGTLASPIMIPSGPGLTCKLLYDRRSKYSEPHRMITVRSL